MIAAAPAIYFLLISRAQHNIAYDPYQKGHQRPRPSESVTFAGRENFVRRDKDHCEALELLLSGCIRLCLSPSPCLALSLRSGFSAYQSYVFLCCTPHSFIVPRRSSGRVAPGPYAAQGSRCPWCSSRSSEDSSRLDYATGRLFGDFER